MDIPTNRKYTKSHEWCKKEDDGSITVGITHHAQELLGDLVFIDLPKVDTQITVGTEIAVVESVKAASDVYAPISGTITETNEALADTPELINQDAYNAWLFKIKPDQISDLDTLMDATSYQNSIDASA